MIKDITLNDRVLAMSEAELVAFAEMNAVRDCESSEMEGIPLDRGVLKAALLVLFRGWRNPKGEGTSQDIRPETEKA